MTQCFSVRFVISALLCLAAFNAFAADLKPDAKIAAAMTAGSTMPRLLVVGVACDPGAQGTVSALEQAAEGVAAKRFGVLRGSEAVDAAGTARRRAKEVEAEGLVKQGRKAFDELDAERTVKLFAEALAAFREGDLTRAFEGYVDAWVLRAASLVALDKGPEAKLDLDRVLSISPRLQLSDALFPQEFLRYAEAQRRVVNAAKGELKVRSKPAGARIFLDGSFRGVAPLTIKGLAGGKHNLVALLTGYEVFQDEAPLGEEDVVLVRAEGNAPVRAFLDRVAEFPLGPERDDALRAFADSVGAPQVLAVVGRTVADRVEVIVLRLDAGDGHTLGYVEKSFAANENLAADALLGRAVESDAARVDGPVVYHSERRAVGLARRVAGASLMAAAVALAANGIVFAVGAMNETSTYSATPQTAFIKSQNVAARGKAFAVVADVSFGTALVSAGVGAILAFTTWGQSEPEAPQSPRRP